jgi:phage terminase large subunit-like protein
VPNTEHEGDGFFSPADVYGEIVKFDETVLAVDPSGRGADDTAICGVSGHSGYTFVHSCFGLLGGYEDHVLEFIAREAKRIRANRIVVESNFGDGMFARLLRPVLQRIYPCTIEEVRQSKQKEVRIIETLEPVMSGHRMIVHASVVDQDMRTRSEESQERQRAKRLFHQMTRISAEKGSLMHDDKLDALAIAVEALAGTMSRNAYQEARSRSDEDDDPVAKSWLNQGASISPLFSFL